jgi:two-component system cell cycle sensor histidine kinase/response regulator CckA
MGQMYPIAMGASILVVEDEALIGEMVAEALEEQGFDVKLTSNAADALTHIESGAKVDALFTDVQLPGGMDGSELAMRVRVLRPDMPIVYVSGQWRPSDREHLVSRSVFLPKPYDPRDAGSLLMRLVAMH